MSLSSDTVFSQSAISCSKSTPASVMPTPKTSCRNDSTSPKLSRPNLSRLRALISRWISSSLALISDKDRRCASVLRSILEKVATLMPARNCCIRAECVLSLSRNAACFPLVNASRSRYRGSFESNDRN
ncbi:hypothetical protein HBH56_099840 [Parastagonospora nodorum]|nr:hypothetical protein HBH56_099840 [Parastagonospora nodorum]KAH3930278.1 hypothetical protein HBH54_114160 [Parastagonospora nodorum]KAH4070324.1 hypothetical protein HBH50_097380 [Parastagonospora nodorum]KAH4090888.1 hypothetical protein HBH48_101150 [Parastagonospora nodorum]KAH4093448.1 hypothetical protein HBH46_179620 [Parastagonospora nodorum]